MSTDQIPPYVEAQPGQVVRSQDWNAVQRGARNSIRIHHHNRRATDPIDDTATEDHAPQIAAGEIADGAVRLAALHQEVRDAIQAGGQLADGAVTTAKLANDAVTSAKIANSTIAWDDLSSDVQGRIGSGGGVADGSVTTAKLADGAVTGAKLANDAVTSAKIKDGTIQMNDLAQELQNDIRVGGGVTCGVATITTGRREEPNNILLEHGLGKIPVAIVVGLVDNYGFEYGPGPRMLRLIDSHGTNAIGISATAQYEPRQGWTGKFLLQAWAHPVFSFPVDVVWWAFSGRGLVNWPQG